MTALRGEDPELARREDEVNEGHHGVQVQSKGVFSPSYPCHRMQMVALRSKIDYRTVSGR